MSEHAKERPAMSEQAICPACVLQSNRIRLCHRHEAQWKETAASYRDAHRDKELIAAEAKIQAQGEALTQAQADLQDYRIAIKARDRQAIEVNAVYDKWASEAKAELAGLRNDLIVLQAEAEVGQQVRELVTAYGRDGETVVGAVQRLIAEQAGLRTAYRDVSGRPSQELFDAALAEKDRELAGLRAQVQALRDECRERATKQRELVERGEALNPVAMSGMADAREAVADELDALLSSVSLPQQEDK